jgi:hypothetical protein
MADDQAETGTHGDSTNGVPFSGGDRFAAARAAFVANDAGPATLEDKPKPGKPAAREVADDDSDLDGDEDRDEPADDDAEEVDADAADDEDPDADLDEDEGESKDADKDADKGIDKVRRTEKRMREQLKKERSDAEAEIAAHARQVEHDLQQKWGPRIEAAEQFEKHKARVNVDPLGVLQALGLREDSYEQLAQVMYTLAKAKDDPKARAAAAQLMKARELDDEVANLKKWREDREKADRDREMSAAEEKKWDAYFDRVTKTGDDKTALANAWLKADPDEARERMHVLTAKLARDAGGRIPSERAVMIALEKDRRAALRKLGIDPKTRSAIAASGDVTTEAKAKPAAKQGDKKAPTKTPPKDDDKMSPRERFIALSGKRD